MDFTEPDELRDLRAAVARIGADFGHDYFVECTREGRFVDELWKAIFDNGFGGVNLPTEFGGGGGGTSEQAVVIEELSAAGCPLLFLIVAGMCGPLIDRFGTDEQRRAFLPGLADGGLKMAFAVTEASAGSDARNLATRAVRDGDRWIIDGTKQFITNFDVADSVLLVTRTGEDAKGKGRLTLFVVDTDTPGIEFHPIEMEIKEPDKQFTVHFEQVSVPAERLIGGEPHLGMSQLFASLNPERINVAAQAIGLSRYFLDRAVAYACERAVWGVPIGSHQGVAHPLAEAKIQMELARLMTAKAAWLFDNDGEGVGEAASVAKLAAADSALLCFDRAVQVHGGNAFASEYGIADLWGLARLMKSAPVSREMVLNYVAQHSMGLPRSY